MDTILYSSGFGWPIRTRCRSRPLADTAYRAQRYPVFKRTQRSNAYILHTSPNSFWRIYFSAAMLLVYCGINGRSRS